ncbi:MAG TPA: hypothetical protein DHU79_08645 [Clostridiales bacterium]|nr:hypothetical protein [Clostridiales bacterium]
MNEENLIEQEANKELQNYENSSFKERFVSTAANTVKIPKRHKRLWLYCGTISLVLLIIVASVLPFVLKSRNEVGYLDENINRRVVDVSKVNSLFFKYKFNESMKWSTKEAFDTLSNDILFYELMYSDDDTAQSMIIVVVVNPKYNYKNNTVDYNETSVFNELTWKYRTDILSDDIVEINVLGETTCEEKRVYFQYTELSFTTESNVSEFLENALVKG